MAGDIDFLPLDIVFHILLYLPVSSLLRFKSVSKSWLSLIQTPDFVHKHIASNPNQQQPNVLLLSCTDEFNQQQQQISLFSVHNKSELSLDLPIINDPYRTTPVKMVASCNGLVCLQQHRRVCLWNHATKQYSNLPPLPVWSQWCSIGFGFDSRSNDYKVVAINRVNDYYVFHIYSLCNDSWRGFEGFVLPDMLIRSDIKAPYRDRVYCWFAWTDGGDQAVYTFDFCDEVFQSIPQPSGVYIHALFILTENIACVGELKNGVNGGTVQNTYYEIWMLSDYEVKESWTKLYSIETISESIDWMTCFSNNGDFVLFLAGKRRLCLYDLVTREVTNVPVCASDGFEALTYRESMISVKRGNGAANEATSMDWNKKMLINQSTTRNNSLGDSDAVVFRILLWLPVVSLLRLKSVCKSWYSLIKSPDFVAQHLFFHHQHQDTIDNFNLILHASDIHWDPLYEDSSHHSLNTSCTCLLSADTLELLDLPYCDSWSYGSLYITISFNGIICLKHGDDRNVYLWNPVTKQFRVVLEEWLSSDDGDEFCIGFGFDVRTNDYKLVRFYGGVDTSFRNVVQVYSLCTDSWRTIDGGILPTLKRILPTLKSIKFGLDEPYRNEIYCWLAEIDDTTDCHTILSFDFGNEVFGTIPLPDSINMSSLTLVLTVLRDKIACISLGEKYFSDVGSWHCEIWMMNEYGDKESWVKLYKVGPFSKDWCFKMCLSKKNRDYILLLKDGQLYEYDLVTQVTKGLPCQIKGPKDYQVLAYKESLVPIKRGSC